MQEKTHERPLDSKEIKPANINPEYSLEGLRLNLKLQYFSHLTKELTYLKRPWCWERVKAGREGDYRGQDGLMASPAQWYEFEQTLGAGEGQRSLACCSPWGHKELDTPEWLKNNEQMRTSCIEPGTLLSPLWWPKWPKWERNLKKEWIYVYV